VERAVDVDAAAAGVWYLLEERETVSSVAEDEVTAADHSRRLLS
jgi:hypothetical protein